MEVQINLYHQKLHYTPYPHPLFLKETEKSLIKQKKKKNETKVEVMFKFPSHFSCK